MDDKNVLGNELAFSEFGGLVVKSLSWSRCLLCLSFGVLTIGIAVITRPFGSSVVLSGAIGLGAAIAATLLALSLLRAPTQLLIAGFLGLLAGCVLGLILTVVPGIIWPASSPVYLFIRMMLPLVFAYVGLVLGISKGEGFVKPALSSPAVTSPKSIGKLLDSSVLIDGRITDIVDCGFLEGPLLIPRFVLNELQIVADSTDTARRTRGRRGLDVVQQLQDLQNQTIQITQHDFAGIREVDLKLVELARTLPAQIVTNDFNLNKLAKVQGIKVLNINQLASSLKPIVLPGELMHVFILKEGKEYNQGIAYLDDGTMVVVDNARRFISKHVDIVVTSVLQTTAGKMIFGRYDERAQAEIRPVSASAS